MVAGGSVSGGESSAGIGAPEQANANAKQADNQQESFMQRKHCKARSNQSGSCGVCCRSAKRFLESGSLRCSTSITLTLWGSRKCRSRKAAQNRFESVTYNSTLFS